jgi:hypothetical protein
MKDSWSEEIRHNLWPMIMGAVVMCFVYWFYLRPADIKEGIISLHEGRSSCIMSSDGTYYVMYRTR